MYLPMLARVMVIQYIKALVLIIDVKENVNGNKQ